jgi:hypothetical protein
VDRVHEGLQQHRAIAPAVLPVLGQPAGEATEHVAGQGHINQRHGTKLSMPVVYYSQLMSVAYCRSAKEAGLDGQVIRAKKLEEIANK